MSKNKSSWETMAKKQEEEVELPTVEKVGWKPLKEARQRHHLKIGVWGGEGVGKSFFGLSCPEPIYAIDTEMAIPQLLHHYPQKKIHYLDAVVIDKVTDKIDPIASLQKVEDAITSLRDVEEGTILLDSCSDIWTWVQAWLHHLFEAKIKQGKFYQFHWAPANKRYRSLVFKLLARPCTIVITAHEKEVWSQSGEPTGLFQPRWQKRTGHWVDFVIHLRSESRSGKRKFFSYVDKCRFDMRNISEAGIEDITYQKLYDLYKEVIV